MSKKYLVLIGIVSFIFGFTINLTAFAAGPATIDLGSVATTTGTTTNFVILAETAITDANSTLTTIVGDVGLSSAAGSNITGLSCTEITGSLYEVDDTYTGGHDSNTTCKMANPPLGNKTLVDNSVLDMGIAYVDGNTRPAATGAELNVGAGTLNGQNFVPELYTWTTNVNITGDITLTGGASDIWIFQVTGTLDLAASKQIVLAGGAVSSNVFWVVTGATTLFPSSVFRGNILDQTSIAMQLGAVLQGRALAQTAVTLIGNNISTTDADIDTTPPVITLDGVTADITVGGTYTELGATATDDVDAPFAATPSGSVDTAVVGSYIITYNATDSSANDATPVTRTVNVIARTTSGGSSGGGTHYGCKDTNATNYEFFAASKPSLCLYAAIITPISTIITPIAYAAPIIPFFPNTGFGSENDNLYLILTAIASITIILSVAILVKKSKI